MALEPLPTAIGTARPEVLIPGLGVADQFQPEEYSVSYEKGKTLTFYEKPCKNISNTGVNQDLGHAYGIVAPFFGYPSYEMEQWVQFNYQGGTDGTINFRGKIKDRVHVGENNNEGFRYTVHGVHQLANEIFLQDKNGFPTIYISPQVVNGFFSSIPLQTILNPNTTIPDATLSFTIGVASIIPLTIQQGIQNLFTSMASALNAEGITTKYDVTGIKTPTSLPTTIALTGPFVTALQNLCSYSPGVQVYYDDTNNMWKFVDMFNAPTMIVDFTTTSVVSPRPNPGTGTNSVTFSGNNVMNHNIKYNTSGRYTAIVLMAEKQNAPGTIYQINNGGRFNFFASPAWDPALENAWTRQLGSTSVVTLDVTLLTDIMSFYADAQAYLSGRAGAFPIDNQYYHVFRTFYVNYYAAVPTAAEATISYWDYKSQQYVTTAAKAVLSPLNGVQSQYSGIGGIYVMADQPIVVVGNPDDPGKAKGPNTNMNHLTTATVDFQAPTYNYKLGVTHERLRWPPFGYEGTAFTQFGVQREKLVQVDPAQLTTDNAKTQLLLYKDVLIDGTVPIEGAPIPQFANLQYKIRLRGPAKPLGGGYYETPISSVSAFVTGYTYKFGKRGVSNITFTTDPAGFIRNQT